MKVRPVRCPVSGVRCRNNTSSPSSVAPPSVGSIRRETTQHRIQRDTGHRTPDTGRIFNTLTFAALIALALLVLTDRAPAADPWSVLAEAAATRDAGEARKQLEALLLEQPDFHAGHFNLGTLLIDSDPEAAAAHLERATASPQAELAADAWHNLALARWKQGRLEDAVAAAGKVVALRPDQPEAQRLRDELRRVLIARADEARRKAEEEARKLHLATTALPDAHVGEAYDQRIAAAGGKPDYRFSLGAPAAPPKAQAAGAAAPAPTPPPALPEGFDLDADGHLHGTPAKAGRYDLPLAIRDAAGTTIDGALVLAVIPAPAITTTQLPEAILGSPYQAELASEGLADPAWTVDGLPPGLALQPGRGATATIRGTPERAGAFTLRVTADDGQRRASSAPPPAGGIPLTVSELFAPEQAVLPPATAWAPYRFKLGVRGPPQAYRWQAKPQSGMTIAEDGAVGGTPQQAGTLTLQATILAEDGRSRDVTVNLPVNPPPVIQESAPIELAEGQAVDRPFAVAGGTPPYLWHLADGVLPKGLRLDPDGALRGAPTERSTTEVAIALHDHWQAATQQKLTVTVKPSDKKKDQQKDQQKQDDQAKQDQQQGDQQKQDQQKGGKQGDQQKQDQARKDPGSQQKDDQQKQQGGQQKQGERGQGDQAKADRGEGQRPAAQDAAQQAQVLNQVAADRWLDQLPKENRGVLRYQLLEGGEKTAPRKDGKTW